MTLISCASYKFTYKHINSFLASGNFCCLLITFAIRLDSDQDQQSFGPDLNPNVCHSDNVVKGFFLEVNLKKLQDDNKSMENYSACNELNPVQ